jgi:hypothetical protein
MRAALVAALLLAAGSGVAWATGVVGGFVAADGTITACVQKDSFNTRIVPNGTACRSTEQQLTFNQKGLKGDQGVQGIPGVKGDPGDPGQQGGPGPQGEQGAQGLKGDKGDPGVDGINGTNGRDGTDGTNGTDGMDGKDGSDLIGSPCSLPNGTRGTVEMTVAANGAISWTCHTATPPNLCPDPLPAYPNAVTSCDAATGNVSITCNAGFQDRNGNIADGCEFSGSAEVCNGIDDDGDGVIDNGAPVPAIPNGTSGCVNGAFKIVSCNAGFADADGLFADGCEVNLLVDPNNCGSIGNHVPSPGTLHANWACSNGTIVLTSCVPGWTNVNGSPVDGCEAQVDPDSTGNTQGTAILLGSQDCFDSNTRSFSGAIANPNDNDWYAVSATGGTFCLNDYGSTYGAASLVVYDLITNLATFSNISTNFTESGLYSNGTTIFFHVHSLGGGGSYSLQFHL